jgi:hypothetical protein
MGNENVCLLEMGFCYWGWKAEFGCFCMIPVLMRSDSVLTSNLCSCRAILNIFLM